MISPPLVMENNNKRRKRDDGDDVSRIDSTLQYYQCHMNDVVDQYLLQEASIVHNCVQQWQQHQNRSHKFGRTHDSNRDNTDLCLTSSGCEWNDPTPNPTLSYHEDDNKIPNKIKMTPLPKTTDLQQQEQERHLILQQAFRMKRIATLLQQYNEMHTQVCMEINQK
jgi:hypothetical protein